MVKKAQVTFVSFSCRLKSRFAVFGGDSENQLSKPVIDEHVPALLSAYCLLEGLETYCRSPDVKSSSVSFGLNNEIRSASFRQSL